MANSKTSKIQKQNIGNSGEYYIASRLSALDFVVTITLGRAEKYDILALSPNGNLIKMSVKTKQLENATDFPLSRKDESGAADDFYYAFIRINDFRKEPDFWVIPSGVVCPLLKNSHKSWLSKLGRDNKKHKDTAMRVFPIEPRKSQAELYPTNWEEEVKKYYKNLGQLL